VTLDADRYAWIRERIARVPRIRLALTPIPLEEAANLSRALGGPRILIKRDDLTGIAFGGNKLRNLEFRLARAIADPIRSSSGWTSNRTRHARRSAPATSSG
jgi:1-aminocyclopropane-1-carboxylate deaminase/D-cysteine desulfhydrase-like pyridoxal-dependent ACC family enzyme